MTRRRTRVAAAAWGSVLGLIGMALVTATPVHAQTPPGNSGPGVGRNPDKGWGNQVQDVLLAQTPELSSLALFGTGAAGMAGYAVVRLRAGRRHRR